MFTHDCAPRSKRNVVVVFGRAVLVEQPERAVFSLTWRDVLDFGKDVENIHSNGDDLFSVDKFVEDNLARSNVATLNSRDQIIQASLTHCNFFGFVGWWADKRTSFRGFVAPELITHEPKLVVLALRKSSPMWIVKAERCVEIIVGHSTVSWFRQPG